MTPMLAVDDLHISYGAVAAIQGASLRVDAGQVVAVLGVNGAGKSSLLRAICGLLRPDRGEIRFEGKSTRGMSPLALVQKGIVMCPEGRQLFSALTVAENLKLGAIRTGMSSKELKREFDVLVELFPVIGLRRHQKAETLSGGEQQMVAIARALIAQPRLLLLDEPSLGVAPILARQIFAKLRTVADHDTGILVVEQNARLALAIADRAYVVRNGKITRHGTSREVHSFLYEGEYMETALHDRSQGAPC